MAPSMIVRCTTGANPPAAWPTTDGAERDDDVPSGREHVREEASERVTRGRGFDEARGVRECSSCRETVPAAVVGARP